MKTFKHLNIQAYCIVILLTITGCKKEITTPHQVKNLTFKPLHSSKTDEIEYQLIDGRLKFYSEDDFNAVLLGLDELTDLNQWETSIGFNSWRAAYSMEEALEEALENEVELNLEDLQLATLLNSDGIIQVDSFIIKLIPTSRKAIVLDEVNIASLPLLKTATKGDDITLFEYSFDDDVFADLAANPTPATRAQRSNGCSDRIARGRNDPKDDEPCGWIYYAYHDRKWKYWVKLDYNRHAINHKLFLDVKRRQRTRSSVWKREYAAMDVDFEAAWSYCARCGYDNTGGCPDGQGGNQFWKLKNFNGSTVGGGRSFYWYSTTEQEFIFYRGSRLLKAYDVSARTIYTSCLGDRYIPDLSQPRLHIYDY